MPAWRLGGLGAWSRAHVEYVEMESFEFGTEVFFIPMVMSMENICWYLCSYLIASSQLDIELLDLNLERLLSHREKRYGYHGLRGGSHDTRHRE